MKMGKIGDGVAVDERIIRAVGASRYLPLPTTFGRIGDRVKMILSGDVLTIIKLDEKKN